MRFDDYGSDIKSSTALEQFVFNDKGRYELKYCDQPILYSLSFVTGQVHNMLERNTAACSIESEATDKGKAENGRRVPLFVGRSAML